LKLPWRPWHCCCFCCYCSNWFVWGSGVHSLLWVDDFVYPVQAATGYHKRDRQRALPCHADPTTDPTRAMQVRSGQVARTRGSGRVRRGRVRRTIRCARLSHTGLKWCRHSRMPADMHCTQEVAEEGRSGRNPDSVGRIVGEIRRTSLAAALGGLNGRASVSTPRSSGPKSSGPKPSGA
jgi:hypothetical protein